MEEEIQLKCYNLKLILQSYLKSKTNQLAYSESLARIDAADTLVAIAEVP